MYYVYLLKSQKTSAFYVGYTSNLRKRVYSHNLEHNQATKAYGLWKLVYFEAYPTKPRLSLVNGGGRST